jgi:hypothetical protein
MYTILVAIVIGLLLAFVSNVISSRFAKEKVSRTRSQIAWSAICYAGLFAILGALCAGKFARESIPLREFVSSEMQLGAPRNADGSVGSFLISRKDGEWEPRVYHYFAKTSEGALVPLVMLPEYPILIVEDASLTNSGVLVIYERERDPKHHLNDWAIVQSLDKRVAKYVFKVPPGTVATF